MNHTPNLVLDLSDPVSTYMNNMSWYSHPDYLPSLNWLIELYTQKYRTMRFFDPFKQVEMFLFSTRNFNYDEINDVLFNINFLFTGLKDVYETFGLKTECINTKRDFEFIQYRENKTGLYFSEGLEDVQSQQRDLFCFRYTRGGCSVL